MAGILMNSKEAEVKSTLGFTQEQWYRFQVEARYEYDTHLHIFEPERTWKMLDLAQKRECIARLTAKSEGADRSAAEWSLHHLHVAARTRMRAAMKSSKNIPEKAPAIAEASTRADNPISKPTSTSTSKLKFDPVREAAEDAKKV